MTSLAFSPKAAIRFGVCVISTVFVPARGVLAVSDYKAGKVVATAPIGMGVDGSGYDAATGDVFTSNGEGTLTVIHEDSPDKYHVVQNLQTTPGSRNMGLDPTTHKIFVVTAKFGPPAAGARRGAVLPDSFGLLVVERPGG